MDQGTGSKTKDQQWRHILDLLKLTEIQLVWGENLKDLLPWSIKSNLPNFKNWSMALKNCSNFYLGPKNLKKMSSLDQILQVWMYVLLFTFFYLLTKFWVCLFTYIFIVFTGAYLCWIRNSCWNKYPQLWWNSSIWRIQKCKFGKCDCFSLQIWQEKPICIIGRSRIAWKIPGKMCS